jgi:hypothetical protein
MQDSEVIKMNAKEIEDQSAVERLHFQLQDYSTVMRINRAYEAARASIEHGSPTHKIVHARRPSKARRALNIELLKREYTDGQSLRQLAATHKVDRKTAASRLRKAGVTLRLPSCNVHRGPLA